MVPAECAPVEAERGRYRWGGARGGPEGATGSGCDAGAATVALRWCTPMRLVGGSRSQRLCLTFSTPTDRCFVRRGRGKGVVDEGVGRVFQRGVGERLLRCVNHYAGLKQHCWVHLLRDIDELKALCPEDTAVAQWATAVCQLYGRAKACAVDRSRPASGYQPSGSPNQLMLEKLLLSLFRPSRMTKQCRRPSSAVA